MSRKALRVVVALGVVILSGVVLLRVYILPREGASIPGVIAPMEEVEAAKKRPPGMAFTTLRLAGSHKGVKQWEMVAREVSTDDAAKMAEVVGLERVAIYREGKVYFEGSADRGSYNLSTKDVEVLGRIKLRNASGDSFATERVVWTSSTEVLDMPGRVAMVLDGRKIGADRAWADIESQIVTAEGNVTIEGSDERITGGKLVYNIKDKSLALQGQTEIQLNL